MNRRLIFTLLITFSFSLPAMENDSEEEVSAARSAIEDISNNPRQIYESDSADMKSEKNSSYAYPMNLEFFRTEEMQKKLAAINDYLWPQHIRITIAENPGQIIATLNQIVSDHTDSGKETLLPFHTIDIQIGQNNLSDTLNKKLIEKRLQKIKELAVQLQHIQGKKLDQDIKEFKKNIPFSQRFQFTAQHRIKPALEDGVAHHVADTLMLPLIKGIETLKELANGLSDEELAMIQLVKDINKNELFLKNLIAVKLSQNKLQRSLALGKEAKKIDPTVKENFIKNFENATQY